MSFFYCTYCSKLYKLREIMIVHNIVVPVVGPEVPCLRPGPRSGLSLLHQQTQMLLFPIFSGEIIGNTRLPERELCHLFSTIFPIIMLIFPIFSPIISTRTIIFTIIFAIILYYCTYLYIIFYYFSEAAEAMAIL